MFELTQLVGKLDPRQTALLLGAGASIPSGAPSGDALKQKLAKKLLNLSSDLGDYSLAEVCSLYERTLGRASLVKDVVTQFRGLKPTGGIQLLPTFDWYRIYGTNFDLLVEDVYRDAGVPLRVVRSNFDFSVDVPDGALEYFKIHGCVTEDSAFGNHNRMLLTEHDYESYEKFQEASFRALAADMLTKDILIVGQSLADPHLKNDVRRTLRLHAEAGTPGRVFVLAFDRDEGRAQLLHDRGAEVFFGGLDELLGALYEFLPHEELRGTQEEFVPTFLPGELVSVTTDVGHAVALSPDARALFNGSPASYSDIANSLTFSRSIFDSLMQVMVERPIAIVLGAGGVGKTTLARQMVVAVGATTDAAWEHNNSFPFHSEHWIEYEGRLRTLNKSAVLFVDDCTENLSQVSQLVEHIGKTAAPALRLVLTANTGKWSLRSKSRYLYSHGEARTLSRLTNTDISALLDLTAQKNEIRQLVEERFLSLGRNEQIRVLRERCSADMYVCMKNIFASEELDFILLREFAELDEPSQEVYRHVAALEALGARVHRQLIMRTLGVEAGGLAALLSSLNGVISEFDIKPNDGLFGWETRHRVVATTIAKYKYAQQDELFNLFENLLDNINPTMRLEIESAKALCSEEYGIQRLSNSNEQIHFFERVVELLPGEGIPRHRLIRKLLDLDRLDDAGRALRSAIEAVRINPVLARYEVALLLKKADISEGLMDEDRIAILLDAEAKALKNVTRYPNDMHSYRTYGDVGIALVRRGAGPDGLANAIEATRTAEATILDPKLSEFRSRMESVLRKASAS